MKEIPGFAKGERRFIHAPAYHAKVYEMAEKKGYLGKEIAISAEALEKYGGFENIKLEVQRTSNLVSAHLKDHIPNYYFTFVDGPPEHLDAGLPPTELDALVEEVGKMYFATYDDELESGECPDIAVRNFVYGTTLSNPKPKFYLVDFYPLFKKSPLHLKADISEFLKGYLGEKSGQSLKAQELIKQLTEKKICLSATRTKE